MATNRWMKLELGYFLRIKEMAGEVGYGLERQYYVADCGVRY
jgi:hypothetical protein